MVALEQRNDILRAWKDPSGGSMGKELMEGGARESVLPSFASVNIYLLYPCPEHFASEQDRLDLALKQLIVGRRSWEARDASSLDRAMAVSQNRAQEQESNRHHRWVRAGLW